MTRINISPWFGFAGIMFLLALLSFWGGALESSARESFSYWSTIGLVTAGFILIIVGFYDMLTNSEQRRTLFRS